MFEIRNVTVEGFDRMITAMRRDRGGNEASDSEWKFDEAVGGCCYEIGPEDKTVCLRAIKAGYRPFMNFIGVWAHIEAPTEWWAICSGYFIAMQGVKRKGDSVTRSVFTSYGHLRNLLENSAENVDGLYCREWDALREAVAELPESWLLLDGLGEGRA